MQSAWRQAVASPHVGPGKHPQHTSIPAVTYAAHASGGSASVPSFSQSSHTCSSRSPPSSPWALNFSGSTWPSRCRRMHSATRHNSPASNPLPAPSITTSASSTEAPQLSHLPPRDTGSAAKPLFPHLLSPIEQPFVSPPRIPHEDLQSAASATLATALAPTRPPVYGLAPDSQWGAPPSPGPNPPSQVAVPGPRPHRQLSSPTDSGIQPMPPPPAPKRGPPPPKKSRIVPVFSDDDPQLAATYDHLAVNVTGRAPPQPLLSYNELAPAVAGRRGWRVPPLLLRNAAAAFRLGRPTPVQSHVIPAIMEGRDVLAVSCTGSGKTLSYLLPVLAQLLNRPRTQSSKNKASPDALVLVPTRELAEQVLSEAQLLLRGSHIKALGAHGGVSVAEQCLAIRGRFRRSAGGCSLLVATPGRLLQLVESRRAVQLGRLEAVVVDEADRLMDLGMWPDLKRLLSHPALPTARQTVLVAASLPGPELQAAAEQLLRDRLAVAVGDPSGVSGAVRQHVELVEEGAKLPRLLELLAPGAGRAGADVAAAPGSSPTVVFCHSLVRAEAVARQLAARGVSVALLHRDLTQEQRDEAIQCFRFGVTSVLVATALASRGLNFPDVAHVINYDVPSSANVYIHQVGRTGRGGRTGTANTFFTPANRLTAPWLADCLRRSGSPVPPWLDQLAVRVGTEPARTGHTEAAEVEAAGGSQPGTTAVVPGDAAGVATRGRGASGAVRQTSGRDGMKGSSPATLVALDGGAGAVAVGPGGVSSNGNVRVRRRRVADLADPATAATAGFGSYYIPPPPSRATSSSEAAMDASSGVPVKETATNTKNSRAAIQRRSSIATESGSAGRAAGAGPRTPAVTAGPVVDRRHDPVHWAAVFEEALRPVMGGRRVAVGAGDSHAAAQRERGETEAPEMSTADSG